MSWNWLSEEKSKGWGFILRVILKTLFLFALCNLIFAIIFPMQFISNLSLYNSLVEGRRRFSYGETPSLAYSIVTTNMDALFASHVVSQPKADEYRVMLVGDSSIWGWFLDDEQTLAAYLNEQGYQINGKPVVFYNLAFPQPSVVKDLLILDRAEQYAPDAVIWFISANALEPESMLDIPFVQDNQERLAQLNDQYDLNLSIEPQPLSLWERTLIAQRQELARLLQLQTYGFVWEASGVDQYIPDQYERVRRDLTASDAWEMFGYDAPAELDESVFAFDMLDAGASMLGDDTPLLVVNEPIFISDGENSDLRYNSLYPRWAYDQYRELLHERADDATYAFADFWDFVPAEDFTNSPLHYNAQATQRLADELGQVFLNVIQD